MKKKRNKYIFGLFMFLIVFCVLLYKCIGIIRIQSQISILDYVIIYMLLFSTSIFSNFITALPHFIKLSNKILYYSIICPFVLILVSSCLMSLCVMTNYELSDLIYYSLFMISSLLLSVNYFIIYYFEKYKILYELRRI